MTETTATFHRPTTPAPVGITPALQVLADADAAGLAAPHMTILWASPNGPEISMNTLTADEFAAWAKWLNIAGQTKTIGGVTTANTTRNGVCIYLGTRATKAA